ncbi:MAG: threonine synthase [Chloroflexi bacterium]|uniref:threonine synthase n=1 Tax=Candidatus Flexifilum breve TaxID=3140694 RepID=UPI003134E6E1|nr:threonine synthase [Chloroflexota bacterium]
MLTHKDTNRIELECINCHTRIPLTKSVAGCPQCGENILEARYDLSLINVQEWLKAIKQRGRGLWRYFEVLPLYDPANIVSLGEGGTPLVKSRALASMLGLRNLFIKDERQGPTASFKDRQATVAISAMKEIGVDSVVVASTGNVAIAYAAYGARAGIKLWAFFPSLAPAEKMREAAVYGAEVIKITGTYDQTKEIAARYAKRQGLFLDRGIKSVAAIEAMKTMAYEIAEQLGEQLEGGQRWRSPDWFIQGVSGGMGPIGVGKGFREMIDFGLVDKMPAMGMVQSTGCAPMVEAFNRGQRIATPVEDPQTIISTLATGNPGRAYELLYDYVAKYGGHFTSASDEEAFHATRLVARNDGLSVEPATAVAFAGLFKMVREGVIKPDDVVVVNCSGHTMPVETQILGDQWQRSVDVSERAHTPLPPQEGLASAMEQIDAQVRRVVVIEDTPDAARLIRRVLQAKGAEVHLAHDGATGLQIVRQMRPDLVITDLMMPNVDGFEVIDTLKADPDLQHIPVVVITAKELTAKERARLNSQVDLLLQKGSTIDEDVIENLVDKLN